MEFILAAMLIVTILGGFLAINWAVDQDFKKKDD